MRVCSIASGSSGNCIYVGSEKTNIIIDAGVSRKRIVDGLKKIQVDPEKLDAILVTHEHSDHICGIPMMEKMFQTPIYSTGPTLDAIRHKDKNDLVKIEQMYQLYPDKLTYVGDIEIMPFHISHDAADPVGYSLFCGGHKVSIATDMGTYDDYTISHLHGSEAILLEANHDISMLETGPYPYALKRRILSEYGHLSNETSGELLCRLFDNRLKYTFLAHLSKENNYPELAFETVKCKIWEKYGIKELPFHMEVAKREEPSRMISL